MQTLFFIIDSKVERYTPGHPKIITSARHVTVLNYDDVGITALQPQFQLLIINFKEKGTLSYFENTLVECRLKLHLLYFQVNLTL